MSDTTATDTNTTDTNTAETNTAETTAPEVTATGTTATDTNEGVARASRKVREGTVVSDKMDKTAVVEVVDRVRHAKYNKFVLRTKKLYAHDEAGDANVGDRVRVMETRPLSKSKRWRIVEIIERAK